MNYVIDLNNILSISKYGVNISQCGILKATGDVSSIPHIYENYVLTFVIRGSGTYNINGKLYPVEAGWAFLTAPNVTTSWTTSIDDPWEYLFIVFNGSDHLKLLKDIGLGTECRVFKYTSDDAEQNQKVIDILFDMYNESKKEKPSNYKLISCFYMLLDFLARNHYLFPQPENQKKYYYNNVINFIADNYERNITVEDMANFVNIDRTYLYRIFLDACGESPLKYLSNFRLQKAVQMMTDTNLSLNDIADAAGFYDYSHFSRSFKKKFSVRPSEYIKKLKK